MQYGRLFGTSLSASFISEDRCANSNSHYEGIRNMHSALVTSALVVFALIFGIANHSFSFALSGSIDTDLMQRPLIEVSAQPSDENPTDKAGPTATDKTGAEPDQVSLLKKQIIETQNNSKLGFRKVVLCSRVEGFGMYWPLNPEQPASSLVLYFEPSNVSTMVSGDRYVIDCTVDLVATDSTGKVVFGQNGILKINRVSRSPILDLFFNVKLALKKPPKETLTLATVFHDKIKNQSITIKYKLNFKSGDKAKLEGI